MVTIGRMSLGYGSPEVELGRVASVMYGMFRAMVGAPTLYYRSLGTVSILLKMDNILGRPYC
jgi:hypothetical protein